MDHPAAGPNSYPNPGADNACANSSSPPPPPPYAQVPATPAPPPPAAPPYAGLASDVTALISRERSSRGLSPLGYNAALAATAEEYAALHVAQPDPFRLDHNLDGSPQDRARRHGYSGAVGEVLAVGASSAPEIVNLWLNSPPHASILLGPEYSEIGLGCAERPYTSGDGYTWQVTLCVGVFGAP